MPSSSANPNFGAGLTYTATDVFLTLTGTRCRDQSQSESAERRQCTKQFVNGGGTLPPGFAGLFGLTGGNLANALSQLDGEAATGAERAAIQLTNEFLN